MTARQIVLPGVEDTQALGRALGALLRAGDLVVLTGGLGAGKTTLTQGLGDGLGVRGPVTSPTFVIARVHPSLVGGPVLVHVDAYRLGGNAYAPGQNAIERLLDELESLGLDEELEDPSDNTIILMEWGEQMAAALAPERLEIHIDRPLNTVSTDETSRADNELTSNGTRTVTFIPVGASWQTFDITRNNR